MLGAMNGSRSSKSFVVSLGLLLALGGCGDDDETILPDSGNPGVDAAVVDAAVTPDAAMPIDSGLPGDAGTMDAGTVDPWTVRSHPCPGINRTDAFAVDDDGTMWLGCGSGTEGDGLFRSSDGGETWSIPDTQPSNVLSSFRVLSVHRGFGGLLYVGGTAPGGTMVISLDTSSSPATATAVLSRGSTVGTSFQASPFVTTASGAAFADSFTGHDALYRADDTVGTGGAEWTNAGDWESNGGSHQILDLVVRGENFVGCGSTIAEPPVVFLPSQEAGAEAWEMTPITLVSGLGAYSGELWGVADNGTRTVAVGVDQDNDVGKIFVSGSDPYDASTWTQTDVDPLVPFADGSGDSTWARGVCMNGDRVVVVGEVQPLGSGDNTGFALESTDGGATFTNITPDGSPATWSKCSIADDGTLRLAGASAIAIHQP